MTSSSKKKISVITPLMSRLMGKPTMWFRDWSDTNWPVQAQKRARNLEFRIEVEEE